MNGEHKTRPAAPDPMPHENDVHQLRQLIADHPIIQTLFNRWTQLMLPDAWLAGSLVAQARWNQAFALPPCHGISDADIVYFNPENLSEEAEARTAARIAQLFSDLPVRIDCKNQARVHQWYRDSFGYEIAPYRSTHEAIATFPTTAAAVGIRPANGLEIVAPFGLTDLLRPVVRANATQITEVIFEAKCRKWRMRWPQLHILPWSEAARKTV